jgi:hypothetical protein
MNIKQVKSHCKEELKFYKAAKQQLWDIKEQKWDGSKILWTQGVMRYSSKIELLEEILQFIDIKS